jgi:hypothetical protein
MASKIFKSTWTWRTLAHQDKFLSDAVPDYKNVPQYIDDEGLAYMFRKTTRKSVETVYVSSVGVLGTNENYVETFIRELMKRDWRLVSVEEKIEWKKITVHEVLDAWKYARINGAALVGAKISAANRSAKIKMAVDKIKERWGMPSNIWPTKMLLKEADISLNSVKSILGSRIVAQANFRAKEKRKERGAKGIRYKRADNYIDEAPDYAK